MPRSNGSMGLAIAGALLAISLPARGQEKPPPAATAEVSAPPPDARVRYVLEGVDVRGSDKTRTSVVLRYIRFHAGDVLDANDPEIELTRYRLLATGFFAEVNLSLRKGSRRGTAVLVVDLRDRNTIIVQNLWLGVAADQDQAGNSKPISPFVGLEAAETNLAGTGILLGAGVGLAEGDLALRGRFEAPSIASTGWSATATFLYNDALDFFGTRDVRVLQPLPEQKGNTDYAVLSYRRVGGAIGTGHDLSISTAFALEYRLEGLEAHLPTSATTLYGTERVPVDFSILSGKSWLSALHASLSYDTRDAPILPKRGSLASAGITVAGPPLGSSYSFARIELSARRWVTLPWGHVLQLSAFAGAVSGNAPFFEKFYVGDFSDFLPDRVLGLAPDRRQPPNLLGTDIVEVRYGDYAGELGAEYRIPLYSGKRSIYAIDLFASGGIWGAAARRDFTSPPPGYSGLARVPVDLTANFGIRVDTSVGGATVAFSNLLGLIPTHTGSGE